MHHADRLDPVPGILRQRRPDRRHIGAAPPVGLNEFRFQAKPFRHVVPQRREPAGAADFLWRISVAEIEASGPFSDFAGYRRYMVLLRGAGLDLRFENGERRTLRRIGDLAAFDGAWRTECELLDGPCADLNLIVADSPGGVVARVVHVNRPVEFACASSGALAVFCIAGPLLVEEDGAEAALLHTWDLATTHGRDGCVVLRPPSSEALDAIAFVARLDHTNQPKPRDPS